MPIPSITRWDWQRKHKKAGDTKNAIACYENALALDKNSIEVRLALAELYTEEKRL